MSLNKKSVDDLNVKGKRVLVRCDFNVPLKEGKITDETRIVAALPTINKLLADGGKVILCSHLGKVKNGPNEGESLAPVAERLSEKLGKPVNFVSDYNVTGEAATKAVADMQEGEIIAASVILLACHLFQTVGAAIGVLPYELTLDFVAVADDTHRTNGSIKPSEVSYLLCHYLSPLLYSLSFRELLPIMMMKHA